MPVINLPTDQRWGALGTGLGSLLGAVVQGVQQRQVAQGVEQIYSDPGMTDDAKLAESIRRYGDQGGSIAYQMLKAKVLSGQLEDIRSQTKLRGAETDLARTRATALEQTLPAEVRRKTAQAGAAEAEIPLREAQTAAALAEVPLRQQEATLKQEETAGAAARTTETQVKTDIERLKLQQGQAAAAAVSAPGGIDAMLAPFNLTPDQALAAKSIAQGEELNKPGSGPAAAMKYAARVSQEKATPQYIEKVAADAAVAATSASRFLEAFDKNPKTGLLKGTTIKAWWEGKGGSTGDADLLNMYDSGLLQAADVARQGGGFWSAGRFQMAKDVTATIADSPLRAVINMDQTADRRLAELRNMKGSQPKNVNMSGVDDAIRQWEDVKARTSAYQTYTTPDGRTVVLHGGDVLDAGSFAKIFEADRTYALPGGMGIKGSEIAARAQKNRVEPRAWLKGFGAYMGRAPAPQEGAGASAPLPPVAPTEPQEPQQ